ncbi:unnamed protein product [Blepharisma stoltei]|uniref:Uncharacterized protein n=1 Tax=Blepharisma stoltei TaxID=1481888 RepID=A0AAU9JJG6_9CILI|nr:unnamed protein product [Blepharisma stoltei]
MGLYKQKHESGHLKKQINVNFGEVEVNGKNACGLCRFLRKKSRLRGMLIGWNFGKFLLDREGYIVDYYGPTQEPLELEEKIIDLLSKR